MHVRLHPPCTRAGRLNLARHLLVRRLRGYTPGLLGGLLAVHAPPSGGDCARLIGGRVCSLGCSRSLPPWCPGVLLLLHPPCLGLLRCMLCMHGLLLLLRVHVGSIRLLLCILWLLWLLGCIGVRLACICPGFLFSTRYTPDYKRKYTQFSSCMCISLDSNSSLEIYTQQMLLPE